MAIPLKTFDGMNGKNYNNGEAKEPVSLGLTKLLPFSERFIGGCNVASLDHRKLSVLLAGFGDFTSSVASD